jgi:hypothetical protein
MLLPLFNSEAMVSSSHTASSLASHSCTRALPHLLVPALN